MSAKNRARADGTRPTADVKNENYPTPAWCVHRLLEAVALPRGRWLEPCAGEGAIIRAVRAMRPEIAWSAVEIRPEARRPLLEATAVPPDTRPPRLPEILIGDFFEVARARTAEGGPWQRQGLEYPFDAVIMNPAFTLAERFARECQQLAPVVAMLQKVTFLASATRQPWLHAWMPDEHVLPNRPIFVGKSSDMIEYAWFVWHADRKGPAGRVSVLALTPDSERLGRKAAP